MRNVLNHTPIGYFKYFYQTMGYKLLFNVGLAVFLGLLDGIGLALFIPLLQFINDSDTKAGKNMGGMHFVLDGFQTLGLEVSLFNVLLFMVLIFSFKAVINYWLSIEQLDLRQTYMVKLRLAQIDNLKQLSYNGFLKLDAGKIQNAITAEVSRNLQAMVQFLISIKSLIVLSAYILLAIVANWQFAFLVIIGGILSNLFYRKIIRAVKTASIEVSRRGNQFNGFMIQCIHHFKYLKATGYFENYSLKLKSVILSIEDFNRKIGKSQALTSSLREPVIILIVAIVIFVQTDFMGASLGSILLSLLLFYRALNGLVTVQNSWQGFMMNVGALQAVSDLSEVMRANEENDNDKMFPHFNNNITLSHLNFSYGEKQVLKDINLVLNRNETIAFVGESGSGKSTLANIISLLIKPASGSLLIDSLSPYNYNLNSYRKQLGYITQEPIIFTDDVYNNVTTWAERTEENIERFWNVMDKVVMRGVIEKMPEKENTVLGDNGILISGGQKQRISIARELYKDVEILIMDEATSSLDSETESYIHDSITNLKGDYTMIIIAHRLSTIKDADRIYLLEDGTISASGNYLELLSLSSRFNNMVSIQRL